MEGEREGREAGGEARRELSLQKLCGSVMAVTHFSFLLTSLSLSVSLPFSSQSSVYVAAVAEEDGGEKIMLSGTLGGNSLKLK